ncbi:hypothetical protein C2S53_009816 [Perilla frutescens var. hirtella]|uniref:Uncharacterized protein n=1 Tax=Perilla frutescens var. hirtella TaxID=608512 RepID=A0AAD4JHB5_PERFH|nr:hypothetical protein C2S53_009816 [Perilla frutescens var. hirtella]
MVGFDFDDNTMKSEKTNSFTARFSVLGEIKKLFRITEIFIVLLVLTWASTRLPSAVRICGEYLRRLVSIVVSHLFVFLLSNVIVLVLFFKSRTLFLQHDFQDSSEIHVDFCQEYLITSGGGAAHFAGESFRQPEDIVYQDKQTILEVTKVRVRRSQSAEIFRREKEDCGKQLRRSETERQRGVEEAAAAAEAEMVEELSNEEFQRAIEAFIAKQINFHREEKLTIVLHGSCN